MRVSTNQFYLQSLNNMLLNQAASAGLQQQISSGKRIQTPSDDPAGMTKTISLEQSIARYSQFEDNATLAEQRNTQEETALSSVTDLLQRIKELVIQSKSGIQNAESRTAIAAEAEERLAELFEIANSRDTNGDYLFSGYKGNAQAFVKNGTGISYNGDQGQQQIKIGVTREIASSDSGFEVFQRIRNGNGVFRVDSSNANTGSAIIDAGSVIDQSMFSSDSFAINFTSANTFDVVNVTTATTVLAAQTFVEGEIISFNGIETSITGQPEAGDSFTLAPSEFQDIFTTLQLFVNTLALPDGNNTDKAFLNQQLNNSLDDVSRSIDHILDVRAIIGSRLNAIESVKDENLSAKTQMQITLSQIQDTDYTSALVELQQLLLTLESSQQTFARMEGVSLFNYI